VKLHCWLALCLLVLLAGTAPAGAASVIYYFPMTSDPGWTATGGWAYGVPGGAGGDPATSHDVGSAVYGSYLDGAYPNDITVPETLTTGTLDCSTSSGTTLTFWRWLGVESRGNDQASVEVSGDDGATWTTVWANPSEVTTDASWQLCSYDIADVADGSSTVRIRWTLGPTNGSFAYAGWNIDDVQIWSGAPTLVLAWTSFAGTFGEYPNTVMALTDLLPDCLVMPIDTAEAGVLADALQGKHVFLVPKQRNATGPELTTAGTEFASVLENFVRAGGTVVDCGESDSASGLMEGTGLMSLVVASTYVDSPTTLTVVPESAWHPLAQALPASFPTTHATSTYSVGADVRGIATDPSGYTAIAVRDYGAGAVIALGWDFYSYDTNAAAALAAAVQYPKRFRNILLYDDSPTFHRMAEALRRSGYAYYRPEVELDASIAARPYDLLAIDNPSYSAQHQGRSIISFVQGGGKSLLSTRELVDLPALGAVYGVSSAQQFSDGPPPLYDWGTTELYAWPNNVPNLLTWDAAEVASRWLDGDRLTITDAGDYAAAGYTTSSTASQAGIAVTNGGATIVNGFLLPESTQDADSDNVADVVELVQNEITQLSLGPYVAAFATASATVVDTPVIYWGYSAPDTTSWLWVFDDGTTSSGSDDATHTFSTPGFHSVSLYATNGTGTGVRTLAKMLAVGFADTPTGYWAFRHIIAGYEAGIVQGYWDGYHPEETVTRAQMAVYMARALAGGDAGVPTGPATATFLDVPTDSWAYKYVEYCYAAPIVAGYWDGYHPEETVNRAQMAVYVARAIAYPIGESGLDAYTPPATASFIDVPTDFWAFKHVEYVKEHGVVTGFTATEYRPEVSVSRAQMAVYLQRAFHLPTYN
jgi:PKD repeat protein